MGSRSSTPRGLPPQRPRIPPRRPWIPSGPDVIRIILEELIREIIDETIRKQRENNRPMLFPLFPLFPLFSQTYMMKSSDGENTEPFNGKALLKSQDASEIPSQYISELQQNPEGLIRSFNLEVPSEYMPEVTAALVEFRRRAGQP
ncbi:hypothetical protein U1Q18_028152 [Sarracenia purpurea var. burkii]